MVGLEAMTHRLVQQHPAERVADDDGHLAAGRVDRVERDPRLARRLLRDLGRVALEQLEADVPAERLVARLDAPIAACDDLHAQPHARAVVRGCDAVGVEDLDDAAVLAVARHHLRDFAAL